MELKHQNFIDEKYRELQEAEQLFFQVSPRSMNALKKGIQIAAVPGAAVVAAHAPIVGPLVAGAVAQGTHLMHSGIHDLAATRIAKHFADLASQVPHGWGRQMAFNTWANVRTADMLAKTDAWARPLSGFAAPTILGKGIIDTGKLAISYATAGIPTVVARPIVHMWQRTQHFILRAQAWFEATLSKLPQQVQQNVRSAIDDIQRRTTAMAAEVNQSPTPNEGDMDRRAEYVKFLSESQNDPSLTYKSIQENIQNTSDLGTDYDKQVVTQALRAGKTLDEATAIISQGPNVTQMSQAELQNVSVYLSGITNSVWKQYNHENPSLGTNQDQAPNETLEAQTVANTNGAAPPPPPEDNEREQSSNQDLDAQTLAESNGLVAEPPDPQRQEQYIQLLAENLEEPNLSWDEVQERINQDPELAWNYDESVVAQAIKNGIAPEEARKIIDNAPKWDGVERPKPAAAQQVDPGLQEDNQEAYRMIKEDVLDLMARAAEFHNLSLRINGEQVLGLGRDGAIDEGKTSLTTEQAQLIRDALQNPKAHRDTEITIKIGTRIAFRLKNGVAQPDKFGLTKPSEEMAVKIPKATPEQIDNLTNGQKKLVADLEKQGLDTTTIVDKMVYKNQTHRPTLPKLEEHEVALSR